ncbi:MAG: hypothetical protein ABIJ57_13815 [Pseudomonadota bacterium]
MDMELRESNGDRSYHEVQRSAEIEAGLEGCFWMLPAKDLAEKLERYNRRMREYEGGNHED